MDPILILREEFPIKHAAIVTAETAPHIQNTRDLLNAVRNAVIMWQREYSQGKEEIETSHYDFNVADLVSCLASPSLVVCLRKHGVTDLSIQIIHTYADNQCWGYDTILCETPEEKED